jgi:hypothetical protein
MASTLLTADEITRESIDIFHQEATVIGSVNRQYDDSFAQTGGKIGDALRIRLPNEYEVGDGEAINPQPTLEESVSLRIQRRKHIAVQFTSEELTMKLDDFSSRVLAPQVPS